MTRGRAQLMYGNKLALYPFSLCILCFGIGWLFAQYGEIGLWNVLVSTVALMMGVHIMDALVKSAVFIKEHFRVSLSFK